MDRNKKTTRMLLILKDEVPSQPIPLIGFIHKPTGVHEDNGAGNNIDTGQNLPQSGQNEPQQGQDLGQNVSYIGQNIPPPPPLVRHGHMFSSAFSAQEGVHEMDDEIMNTSYDNVQPMCDKTTTEDGLVTNDENMDPMNNDFQPSCDKITTQDNSLGYLTTIKDGLESDELAMCYNILTIGSSTSNDVIVEYAAYHEVLLQADQFGKVLIHHKDMRFLKGRYLDHNEHFKVGNKSFKWKYPNEISKNLTNDNMIHDKSTNPETRNICTEQEKPHELHDSCNSTTNHSFSAVTENQNLFEPIQTRSQLSTLQESRNDTEASNIDSAIACEAKSLRSGVVEDETEIGCGVKSGASFEDGRSEVSDDVDDEVKDPTYIENDDDVSDSDCDDCSDIYPAITEVSADANVCCALSKATQTQNIRIVATEESSNAGIRKADNVSDIEEPLQSGSDSQSWSKRRGAQAEKRSADSSDEENEDEVTRSSLRKKSKLKKRIMIEDETDSEEMSDSTSKQPSAEKRSVVDSVEEEKEDEVTRSRLRKKSKFEKKRVIEDETDSEEMSDSASKQPSGTSTKKLVRKRWTDEENKTFTDIFRSEIIGKTMPFASKLQRAAKELKGRSIQQIRTKINNIILDKQKFVLH